MLPHLFESGYYKSYRHPKGLVSWALLDAQGRDAQGLRAHVLDEEGNLVALKGAGKETGVATLVLVQADETRCRAWVLARHAHLLRLVKSGETTRYLVTEFAFPRPAGKSWEREVAPEAAYRALTMWCRIGMLAGQAVVLPTPPESWLVPSSNTLRAAHPYTSLTDRFNAEWLKKRYLTLPDDPTLSALSQPAGFRLRWSN